MLFLFYDLVLNFMCCMHFMSVSVFKLGLGNGVAAYWEKAAHSAFNMFSWYKYLIVKLVFPTSVFWSGFFF